MAVMVTGSGLVLVTRTVKVNGPPGAGRLVGLADLVTVRVGGRLVMEMVALAVALTWVPPVVVAVAVTTSVWVAPASPVKVATNEHLDVPPGAMSGAVLPATHVPRPLRLP